MGEYQPEREQMDMPTLPTSQKLAELGGFEAKFDRPIVSRELIKDWNEAHLEQDLDNYEALAKAVGSYRVK